MNQLQLPVRNAGLYSALRRYVDAAFALMRADVAGGADVAFSVEPHQSTPNAQVLYEYRPLVEGFIRDRIQRISELSETIDAAEALATDPASNAFLRAGRADAVAQLTMVARDELMVPLLLSMAELHPDFMLDEQSLVAQYTRFEDVLYTEQRRYVAVTPVWGVRLTTGDLHIGEGVWLRTIDPEMFRMEWPEAAQLNWGDEAREGLPAAILQFERVVLPNDNEAALDPLLAINQTIAAIRALAGGSICAGPVVWERLDFRALAPRPVLAVAARRCGSLPSKIDATIAKSLPGALRRLSTDPDGPASQALERYQYAATSQGLSALRAIFDALIDIYADDREVMAAGLRIAVVVGASLPERQQFAAAMRHASVLIRAAQPADADVSETTRLLAAALRATIASALVGDLPLNQLQSYADSILLGERERRRLGAAAMKPILN